MKTKNSFLLLLLVMAFFSCSPDEEPNVMSPSNISFVHADGTAIAENECINLNMKYAIKVETTSKFKTKGQPLRVDYTVNGVVYTMNFSIKGAQIIPIVLVEGDNLAQILGSDYKAYLKYQGQGDFELVE